MANEMVQVKLLKPFSASKDGGLHLKMGDNPGRTFSATGMMTLADFDANGTPISGQVRIVPGQPIYARNAKGEDKLYAEEGRDTTIIPMDWAKLYFGDWEAPEYPVPGSDPNRNKSWSTEREQVATVWGYFKYAPQPKTKMEDFDDTHSGPPDMPYVELRVLNAAGQPSETPINPREHWGFNSKADFPTYDFKKSPAKVVK